MYTDANKVVTQYRAEKETGGERWNVFLIDMCVLECSQGVNATLIYALWFLSYFTQPENISLVQAPQKIPYVTVK